jgi:hypothetical protein
MILLGRFKPKSLPLIVFGMNTKIYSGIQDGFNPDCSKHSFAKNKNGTQIRQKPDNYAGIR